MDPTAHHKESIQMPRILAAIVLVAVLALAGGLIASTAYQAGVNTAVTTATASGAAVAPVVVPGYGYGYGYGYGLHPFGFGFGIFGFLGTLLFLFIVFGLIRAIFWRGGYGRHGGWGRGGWGGPGGPGGPGGSGQSHWETKANETFEDWHRRAHASTAGGPGSGPTTPPDPA
jgi:hypothetical protein